MRFRLTAGAVLAAWLGGAQAIEVCSAAIGCSDTPGNTVVFDGGAVTVDGALVPVSGELVSITGGAGTTLRILSPLAVGGSLTLAADVVIVEASGSVAAGGTLGVTVGGSVVSVPQGTPLGAIVLTGGGVTLGGGGVSGGAIVVSPVGGAAVVSAPISLSLADPDPGDQGIPAVLPIADVVASIAEAGNVTGVAGSVGSLALNGAHHRPLLAMALEPGERCLWLSGDGAVFEHGDHDARAALAELGGCVDLLPSRLRAGLGVGKSYVREDLNAGGRTRLDGEYLVGELDYRLPDTSFIVSVLGLFGRWDADIHRAVTGAGAAGVSIGDTDVTTASARFRVDWRDALSVKGVSISPRVALTVRRTEVDGYTETGGALPLRFDDRRETVEELRYGFEAEKRVARASARFMLEGVHVFDDRGAAISGSAPGVFSFDIQGQRLRSDWARAGVELEYGFAAGATAAASVNASTTGRDPSVSGGVTVQLAF